MSKMSNAKNIINKHSSLKTLITENYDIPYDASQLPNIITDFSQFLSPKNKSSITPDISELLRYDYINNPLGVRRVSINNSKFIPEREYSYYTSSNHIVHKCFVNADNYDYDSSNSCLNYISYTFKPLYLIRSDDIVGLTINNTTVSISKSDGNGGYYNIYEMVYSDSLDSKDPPVSQNMMNITINNNVNTNSTYLEVI